MLDIDLVQRLHMVRDKRDRHDQHVLAALSASRLTVWCIDGASHFDAPTLL